jgi:hypothetical protein
MYLLLLGLYDCTSIGSSCCVVWTKNAYRRAWNKLIYNLAYDFKLIVSGPRGFRCEK